MAPKHTWIDPRLFIGAALVAASIAGVVFVVQAASRTEEAYVAAGTLVPGDTITRADLEPAQVRLADSSDLYVRDPEVSVGMVVVTTVRDGELVPVAALADSLSTDMAAVVTELSGSMPSLVARGDVVDLWAAPPAERGLFETPEVLVADAIVASVEQEESIIAGSGTVRVELLVPREQLGEVLGAIANEHAISVVPAGVAPELAP